MTHNSWPYWNRDRRENMRAEPIGQGAPSEPYAELFAVLDRADVSEAVRAALAHALNPPPAPAESAERPDFVDALVDRLLTGRERGSYRPAVNNDSGTRYTLHLTFPAADLDAAREQAASYTEALIVLRPEVGLSPALLSRADQWNHIAPVTCSLRGPDGERCIRPNDHLGCHRDDLALGLCWSDDQSTDDWPGGNESDDGSAGRR
ncbi:hypothetical protein ACWDV4_20845 [Micromonospora sp. NPDC003197]